MWNGHNYVDPDPPVTTDEVCLRCGLVGTYSENSDTPSNMIAWGCVYDKDGNEVDAYYHYNEVECIAALMGKLRELELVLEAIRARA